MPFVHPEAVLRRFEETTQRVQADTALVFKSRSTFPDPRSLLAELRGTDREVFETAYAYTRQGQLQAATNAIAKASNNGLRTRMREGLDSTVFEFALGLARQGQLQAARNAIGWASNDRVRTQLREGLDSTVFEFALGLARQGQLQAARNAIGWGSSDRARRQMREGLDSTVFEFAVDLARQGRPDAARNAIGWGSSDQARRQMREELPARVERDLHAAQTSQPVRDAQSSQPAEAASDAVQADLSYNGDRYQVLLAAASMKNRRILNGFPAAVIAQVDEALDEIELRDMASRSTTPTSAVIARIGSTFARNGITIEEADTHQLMHALEATRAEVGRSLGGPGGPSLA